MKVITAKNSEACLLQQKDKNSEFISERLIGAIKPIVTGIYHIKTHTTETTVI